VQYIVRDYTTNVSVMPGCLSWYDDRLGLWADTYVCW